MAIFRYIGDDGEGPEQTEAFGLVFPKGEPVRVSDKTAIAKLTNNSHFEAAKPPVIKTKKTNGDEG